MTYSGNRDIKSASLPVREVADLVGIVDQMDHLTGKPLKHKAITQARAAAERVATLRNAGRVAVEVAAKKLADAAAKFAAGEMDAEAVARLAVDVATVNASQPEVTNLLDQATRATDLEAITALSQLDESFWLSTLKVLAGELLAKADELADSLYREPSPQTPGVIPAGNPYAPSSLELENSMELRHQWERFGAVLDELDTVHNIADYLRNVGLVGTVPGREFAQDYRWLHADRLAGNPAEVREFFLGNTKHAQPGLYTAAELAEGAPPQVRGQGVDRFTQQHLAGVDMF